MASDPKYGQEPPKNDDGSYKDVLGQFGFLYFHSDGQTLENLKDGSTYDLSNIGGGSSSDTRVDIENNGSAVVSDASQLDTKGYLKATGDGSGGADVAVDLPALVVDNPDRPPIAALNDTESIEIPVRVPDGSTLEVYRWGVFDVSDGSSPTGLTAELLDGGDTVQASESTANNQNKSTPIAKHSNSSGSASIFKLRAYNGTGGPINSPGVGCVFGYRVV